MNEKIYVNWSDFHSHVKILTERLKSQKRNFNRIVAISRGGLIPAGILAYEMNIRNCDIVNISSYDDDFMRDDNDIKIGKTLRDVDSHTLIVDDLADSGRTLRILHNFYPEAYFACVYAKPKGQDAVNCFAQEMPDKWVVFPWD